MVGRTVVSAKVTFAGVVGLSLFLSGCNVDGRRPQAQPQMGQLATHSTSKTGQKVAMGTDLTIADASEIDLVEAVVTYRQKYQENLQKLEDYYLAKGYARKADWAKKELYGLRCVKQSRYILDAEVPAEALTPSTQIPEADALYQRGVELMRRGGHPAGIVYREDRMVEAVQVFRELIERYPTSDKIDDAAFFLGEIHKDYLKNQEEIAVKWYERAWTWDPATPHPVRFHAATVYDYRLHDRDRALELYQRVLSEETSSKVNVNSAARRIGELTEPGAKSAQARR